MILKQVLLYGYFDLGVLKLKTLMNEVNESHFINIQYCAMFLKAGNTIVTLGFITCYLPFTKMQNKSGFVKGWFDFC